MNAEKITKAQDEMVSKLVREVMTWKEYPDQNPYWSGWEYIPKDTDELKSLCEACRYDWWEGVEFGCLQYCENTMKYVICFDCNVWEVSVEEFMRILKELNK